MRKWGNDQLRSQTASTAVTCPPPGMPPARQVPESPTVLLRKSKLRVSVCLRQAYTNVREGNPPTALSHLSPAVTLNHL